MGKPKKKIIYIPKQQTSRDWFGIGRLPDCAQAEKLRKEINKQLLMKK